MPGDEPLPNASRRAARPDPGPAPKPRIEQVREAAVIVRRRGRILLVRRGEAERWAGYWDFPRFACDRADVAPTAAELTTKLRDKLGIDIAKPRHLTTLHHTVTRFRITLECFEANVAASNRSPKVKSGLKWLRPSELAAYPLPSTGRRLARLIAK